MSVSYGLGAFAALPMYSMAAGLRTEYGSWLPPGGKVVAYVHHAGAGATDDQEIAKRIYTTLNAALRLCRAGKGDAVLILPGHAENISSADQMSNLVAGTRIIGLGYGTMRPTFTWTAAAATFLLDQANVMLSNLRLLMDPGAGSVNVAAPITVSAPGCVIDGCEMRMGTDANSTVTIGITTTAAGDDLTISDCYVYGATASVITTGMRFVGADRLRLLRNSIRVGTSAAGVGAVQFLTTASTDVLVEGCIFGNTKSDSTSAFTGMAGLTGVIRNCLACQGAAVGANNGFTTMGSMSVGDGVYITSDDATVSEIYPGA